LTLFFFKLQEIALGFVEEFDVLGALDWLDAQGESDLLFDVWNEKV
jgi:hypothetical protein